MKQSMHSLLIAIGLLALTMPGWAFRSDDEAATSAPAKALPHRSEAVAHPTARQISAAKAWSGVEIQWDLKTGAPASLRGKGLGAGSKGMAPGSQLDYRQEAIAVLNRVATVYRMSEDASREFIAYSMESDALGFHHVRLRQMATGLRVVGGDLIVHFDRRGSPYQVNGRYIPDADVGVMPALTADAALVVARKDMAAAGRPVGFVQGKPELEVYADGIAPILTYALTLIYNDPVAGPGCWRYWVGANDGVVQNRFNDIRKVAVAIPKDNAGISGNILVGEGGASVSVTGWLNGGLYWLLNDAWSVYNRDSSGLYPDSGSLAFRATDAWGASDTVEISAAFNFNLIQNYYRAVHGRNSFNDAGARAVANVHMWGGTDNAYWSPADQEFFFYPGKNFADLAVLDVCAHEFTHAVTEYTADLVYQRESGALNESFSDIFGVVVEFACQGDARASYPNRIAGQADWLLAEDCTYPQRTALRDMRNPARYSQPSRYRGTYWYTGTSDNGGVHCNSGAQNHMMYLLAEGGAGVNDGISYAIAGLGVENARQIAYRALTVYCGPHTDYRAARLAWLSAAQDLNPAWVQVVQAAWAAVGVEDSPVPPGPANLRVLGLNNDYDGDGSADYVVYDYRNGKWYIWGSLSHDWLAYGESFGSSNCLPIPGDYNGGGKSDAMIFDPSHAFWRVIFLEDFTATSMAGFGGDRFVPVPGDYDGDGYTDCALYDMVGGEWYILSPRQRRWLLYGGFFGATDYYPVPGDYNGDGRSDLVLYSEATGDWFILYSNTGTVEHGNFGGPHFVPVPGDYDGDGVSDLALYNYWHGGWYVFSPVAGWLIDGRPWGGYPYVPVPGDFDGDGASDLAVYSPVDALWDIYLSSGDTRHMANFGGKYMVPVVYWPLYWYM